MAKIRMSTTGTNGSEAGFTLVEVVAAFVIVGLVIALAVPLATTTYEGIRYRAGIRDTLTLLESARYAALANGVAQDVLVSADENWIRFEGRIIGFPESVEIAAHSAKEVNRDGLGVIRFYPDGSASGGGIDIKRLGDSSTSISVDWLVGRVSLVEADGSS